MTSVLDWVGRVDAVLVMGVHVWFVLLVAYLLFSFVIRPWFRRSPKGRRVLVTGCDSGFGKLLAERLVRAGAMVFGTTHSERGARHLREYIASVVPDADVDKLLVTMKMDVSDDTSVQEGLEAVRRAIELPDADLDSELYAVVNNAGIMDGFVVEMTPLSTFVNVMDVNLFGIVRVCKAFAPLLKQSKGRFVNMLSMAGRIASPSMAAYACSKHAGEAFSDSLRHELAPWGVEVAVIEPGFAKTDILQKGADSFAKMWEEAPAHIREEYGREAFEASSKSIAMFSALATPPKYSVDAYMDALFCRWIKTRYLVGYDAILLFSWATKLPTFLFDWILGLLAGRPTPASAKGKKTA